MPCSGWAKGSRKSDRIDGHEISGLFGIALICTATASAADHWVATWGASPSPQLADEAQMRAAHLMFSNQTLREIVRVSLGGSSVRVRFFQRTHRQTVNIGGAHIAVRTKDSGIEEKTDRALTFGGRPLAILPPDGVVIKRFRESFRGCRERSDHSACVYSRQCHGGWHPLWGVADFVHRRGRYGREGGDRQFRRC